MAQKQKEKDQEKQNIQHTFNKASENYILREEARA
jgi:hypothetical protein